MESTHFRNFRYTFVIIETTGNEIDVFVIRYEKLKLVRKLKEPKGALCPSDDMPSFDAPTETITVVETEGDGITTDAVVTATPTINGDSIDVMLRRFGGRNSNCVAKASTNTSTAAATVTNLACTTTSGPNRDASLSGPAWLTSHNCWWYTNWFNTSRANI